MIKPKRRLLGRSLLAFTLIEVLVALLIFALAAVVLGAAYVNVLNDYEIAKRVNQRDEALDYARSQLLAQTDLQTAETGAEFDDQGPTTLLSPSATTSRHVKWSAEIDPSNTTDLFSVTFTCEITESGQAQSQKYVENFMLVRPTWSDPTARSQLRQGAASRIAILQGRQPPS